MLYLSLSVALLSLLLCCYTLARVVKVYRNLKDLDWQSLGTLTGDVGSLKVAYQRLNNRIGGMQSTKEKLDINEIALQHIQNSTPIYQQKKNNGGG